MSEADTFQRVQQLFEQALEHSPEEREAFVRAEAGDDAVAEEVLSLLQADATMRDGLDSPPPFPVEAMRRDVPDEIAGYRIVGELGHGGMGVVFEALQPDTDRPVALKIIRSGLFSSDAARRFELEARVLARLDHPGIATIYESGSATTDAGTQHYFAMELVRGEPLTEHVKSYHLGTRERLKLVADIADAVQHAHDRGIVHRDLKPANILITDDGRPKILDFGIARALDPDLQTTMMTHTGQLVGTVAYMAPEQLAARPDTIDHRTDIYALGVILYEVLAGRLPHDLTGRALLEAVRHVEEHTPSSLATLNRSYRGDIDTIAARAMEKDPDRRYATAADLAADLRRHLNDQPIHARPASTFYQFRKFAKRNKALVSSVAVVFAVLVVALVVVSSSLASEREQRLLVQKQRDTLADVNTFFAIDFIGAVDPSLSGSREITLLEAIDQAETMIAERFAGSPEVEGQVRYAIGQAYSNLSELDKAETQLRRSVELARQGYATPIELADRLSSLGIARMDVNDLEEAQSLLTEAAELRKRYAPDDMEGLVTSLNNLGGVPYKRGNKEEAEQILKEAYELGIANIPESDATLAAIVSYALVVGDVRGSEAAEPLSRKALDMQIASTGMENLDTLTAANNYAILLMRLARYDEAEALFKEVLEIRRRILGEEHRHTHVTETMYGKLLRATERYDEAEAMDKMAYEGFVRVLGEDHPYTHVAAGELVYLYTVQGREDEAQEWLSKLPADSIAHTDRYKLMPGGAPESLETGASTEDEGEPASGG